MDGRAFSFRQPVREVAISLAKNPRFNPRVFHFQQNCCNNCHRSYRRNGDALNAPVS
jgi:hypothetical protein